MRISHMTRAGIFRPVIKGELKKLGCPSKARDITVFFQGKAKGDQGTIEVVIGPTSERKFTVKAAPSVSDRFPQRIKAAATALRDHGCTGRFQISHKDGELTIKRL